MQDKQLMDWTEWAALDATAMAELVRDGEVSARELAVQAVQAVELLNPKLNAVIEIFDDVVTDPYRDGMNSGGPFHGVPTLLKDLGSRMKGRHQENGYAWQETYISDLDDPLTLNWRRAGFNLLGRTTCPEGGMSFVTESPKFGKTRNPWNLDRVSGGSSGGSSAVVASGILPVASASDGAGSIRFPAAWTGLVGLKPSRGLNPMPVGYNEGTFPSGVEGMVTRSVRDCAAIHDQLYQKPLGSGFMPYPTPVKPFVDEMYGPERKFRIGLSIADWSRTDNVDPLLKQAVLDIGGSLEGMGHTVEEVHENDICDFESFFPAFMNASWINPLGVGLQATAQAFGVELSARNTSVQVLNHIVAAAEVTLGEHFAAEALNPLFTRQWGYFWERGFDLLLTPLATVQCPHFSAGYELSCSDDFETFVQRLTDAARYASPANATGLPAISLPAGLDHNGCPFAIQFMAPWAREPDLIHIAAQLERANPSLFGQIPPVHVTKIQDDSCSP